MKKAKAHTRYRDKDNYIVPGVTTICNLLNKPALVPWANKLGLQGFDVNKYVDELATIGSLAHYLVECDLKKVEPDLGDYTPNQLEKAKNSKKKFDVWRSENDFEVIETELELVDSKEGYGGCIDIYCTLNGCKTLIDLKTSKGIFPEHFLQTSAYKQLLITNGYKVDDVRILRIGREDSEGTDFRKVPSLDKRWEKFKHLLAIYKINKELK